METLWKQETPLHPTFVPLNRCLAEDWFLLPYELQLQRAHARALHEAGILTGLECRALVEALEQLTREYVGAPCPHDEAEDLHTWVESGLADLLGEPGKKIHTARSRNDQVATLLKMYVIDAGERLSEALRKLVRTCGVRARDWSNLVFPLQTHTQFAAPGTVGFWVLRYAASFHRIRLHLDSCVMQWREDCPLGSGAVAGSSIPIDRTVQATALGFERPSLNALDSTSTRDECLQWLSAGTQAALHLQSLATDVILFSQTPLAWTRYPAAFGTGSSMMPNKTNPDAMELLRGECCTLPASEIQAVMLLKGLPSGYNRDLQCIKPILKGAVDTLLTLCPLAEAFLQELQFDPDRLAASMKLGAIGATLEMEKAVLDGEPLRDAHRAATERLAAPAPAKTSPGESPDGILVERYRTSGGASPEETRRIADELLTLVER